MQLTRSQLIIAGVGTVMVFIILGILIGFIPGLKTESEKVPEIKLTAWGTLRESESFSDSFISYRTLNGNVDIKYKAINPENYETELLNALAAGTGPDIFMFQNNWLPKHQNKITPVPETQMTLENFRKLFPLVVEQDFAPDQTIYATPLFIDTLALFYNQDLFDSAGVALIPSTWQEFQAIIPRLTQKDKSGNIIKSAAAIGGTNENISHASDILNLLMLQTGTKMTNENFSSASFAQPINGIYTGLEALDFYTKFSDPSNDYYTWNEKQEYSLDNFSQGNLAMILAYESDKDLIREKNSLLNFRVTETPQPNKQDPAINYANYWGLAVSNKSQYPDWAWDLALFITTDETSADAFFAKTNYPPALRTLIQKYSNDPDTGIFVRQALTARSWPQIDNDAVSNIFSQTIKAITDKQLSSRDALYQAEKEVSDLMRARAE